MSSRILKKGAAASVVSFQFPNMGGAQNQPAKMQSFVFPEIGQTSGVNAGGELSDNHAPPSQSDDDVLQSARDEAARIVAQAETHAAAIQEAALEKALAEARRTAEAEIAARVDEEVSALRENLAASIAEVSGLAEDIAARAETELLEFALEIAKKIVGREVSIDREVALTLVKISLAKLHNRSFAKIHLNPNDCSFVEAHRERLNFQGSLEIISDNSISPGGCLVHTATGEIDARIESQFDEIAHGLLKN